MGEARVKINLKDSQQLWITSDTHAFHKNICRGTSEWGLGNGQRDFDTVEEMNEALIRNINAKVKENDILIHLGDWSFAGERNVQVFRDEILCKEIILVLGNHDRHIKLNKTGLQRLFSVVTPYLELSVNKNHFILFHFPIAVWDQVGNGAYMLNGHTHKRPENKFGPGRTMDVGIDGSESFSPYNIDEIILFLKDRPISTYMTDDYHHINRKEETSAS